MQTKKAGVGEQMLAPAARGLLWVVAISHYNAIISGCLNFAGSNQYRQEQQQQQQQLDAL